MLVLQKWEVRLLTSALTPAPQLSRVLNQIPPLSQGQLKHLRTPWVQGH